MSTKKDSPALRFLDACWVGIPIRSHRNRNAAMQGALNIAIESGMPFEPGDFAKIYDRYRAHFWIGGNFEGYYTSACSARSGDNISAAIAMETFRQRKPLMWAQRTKVAERLYVGAPIDWDGFAMKVTSISGNEFIACAYSSTSDRVPTRVRRITLEQLTAKRKACDKRRKDHLAAIEAIDSMAKVDAARTELRLDAELLRHFDRDEILQAIKKAEAAVYEGMPLAAKKKLNEAKSDQEIEAWKAGKTGTPPFGDYIYLRVKDGNVETSNYQSASVGSVVAALPLLQRFRKRRAPYVAKGSMLYIENHPVKRIDKKGVQVGCTFVTWKEIDNLVLP